MKSLIEEKLIEVIENIQQAQMSSGGRFIRQKELRSMTVEELLRLMLPNEIEFKIEHKPKGSYEV